MDAQERSSHKECTAIIYHGEAYKNSVINSRREEKTIPYWWSDKINNKRKQCMEARRWYTKIAKTRASIKYKLMKKELGKLISLSKREHWSTKLPKRELA
ncbi:hypothetical protein QE152_g20800 [Popillia japonica]|uniref:Uncharacterized protein n=1 Tax=Popillia japonica TaxID=7064 RepID=A0AAW1KQ02_POPJA